MITTVFPYQKYCSWIREQITDLSYAAGWSLTQFLPHSLTGLLIDQACQRMISSTAKEQLQKNLARVFATSPQEISADLLEASLLSYGRYWREVFELPSMNLTAVQKVLDQSITGTEHLDQAIQAGHGVILALPHSGNWDMAGVWLVSHHGRFTTVAERLKPESLYRRFLAYREHLGFEILALTGESTPPFTTLAQRLRTNHIVCLLAERDLTRSGIPVNFFGEPTRFPSGPARLSLQTGAVLLSAHCWFEQDGWGMRVDPPIDTASGDIATITQILADRFSTNIAQHPHDWHMLQPQWLADLPQQRRDRLVGQ